MKNITFHKMAPPMEAVISSRLQIEQTDQRYIQVADRLNQLIKITKQHIKYIETLLMIEDNS